MASFSFRNLFSRTPQVTPCPFCYTSLDMSRVAFRCSGLGEPGRPRCREVSDLKLGALFGDTTPRYPVITRRDPATNQAPLDAHGYPLEHLARESATCPDCGGSSRIRLCPDCHSQLPMGLEAGSPLFGLVGVRYSGKTVLLSVLHQELTGPVARRFNASISTPGGESGLAQELAQHQRAMTGREGALPAQTSATGSKKKAPAVYEWKQVRGGKVESTIFSFYDSAGEDVSHQDAVLKQKYLAQASGVILLLDPFSFPENISRAQERSVPLPDSGTPESVLDGITFVLKERHGVKQNKKIKTPLAVVVSKIDAFFDEIPPSHVLRRASSQEGVFSEEDSQAIHDHVAALISRWGGDGLLRRLELEYETYRIFGVSALGAEPDYGSSRVNNRGVLPLHVADPLLWLMAQRGFIPTTKG